MNPAILHQHHKVLFIQRNTLLIISSLLLISNLCLATFVITKNEKIIIVPATLARKVLIEGNTFSEEYLEEMALLFTELLLNLTPDNIAYKSSVLLKYAHPSHYQELQEYFKQEEMRFKQYNLSTRFDLGSIKISKMKAEVQGILRSRFGVNSKSNHHATFEIEYAYSSGGIQIRSFKKKEG